MLARELHCDRAAVISGASAPALAAWLRALPPDQDTGTRSDTVHAEALSFARVGDRYLVGAVARAPSSAPIGLALTYASTLFVVLLWAPLCAFAVARLLSSPIRQITDAARQAANNGQMIFDVAAESKVAQGIDQLAAQITGREVQTAKPSMLKKLLGK